MKKKIVLPILLISLLCCGFAREDIKQGDNPLDFMTMRVGGSFDCEFALGEIREFSTGNIGAGADYEVGFKLPVMNMEVGPAAHLYFDGSLLTKSSDKLKSLMDLSLSFGAFLRIPILNFGLTIEPEIGYGLILNIPKANPEYFNADTVKGVYADQVIFFAVGVKYAPPMILSGKLEFSLTPIYQMNPENGTLVHDVGFRVGALYKLM